MNEKILSFLLECGAELVKETHNGQTGTAVNLPHGQMFDFEKFAELIVRECGLWFNNRLIVEPDYGIEHRIERNRAVVRVMKEFNKHFGIEL
jgi:hypothetical protein